MDVDRLFLETLDDLEARIREDASEYDLLRAAALLRRQKQRPPARSLHDDPLRPRVEGLGTRQLDRRR
jgi:hypothetical protein